jgi:hypothetical protein
VALLAKAVLAVVADDCRRNDEVVVRMNAAGDADRPRAVLVATKARAVVPAMRSDERADREKFMLVVLTQYI